jgi:hypothetical protein
MGFNSAFKRLNNKPVTSKEYLPVCGMNVIVSGLMYTVWLVIYMSYGEHVWKKLFISEGRSEFIVTINKGVPLCVREQHIFIGTMCVIVTL